MNRASARDTGRPRILLVDPFTYDEAGDALRQAVAERFEVTRLWELPDPVAFFRRNGAGFRAVQTRSGKGAPVELMELMPDLEIIVQVGSGLEALPLDYARGRNIPVTNTPGVLADDVADIAFGLIIATARRIVDGDHYARFGDWQKFGRYPLARKVSGKTCGIIGLGRIGKTIARRAAGFDMTVLYHGRSRQPEMPYAYHADLVGMAAQSDFLVICCPGGAETDKLVNEEVLRALGSEGIVINVGRGTTLDELALARLLKEGAVGGAGLDVHAAGLSVEPELLKLPAEKITVLPHVGSGTSDTRRAMHELCLANLFAHFDGKELVSPV